MITSHSEYLAAQKRLRSLRGEERSVLADQIAKWKQAAASRRGGDGGAALVKKGKAQGNAALVQLGWKNPNGVATRENRKKLL